MQAAHSQQVLDVGDSSKEGAGLIMPSVSVHMTQAGRTVNTMPEQLTKTSTCLAHHDRQRALPPHISSYSSLQRQHVWQLGVASEVIVTADDHMGRLDSCVQA